MPADDLREAVKALMGQAKDDLAELVSFQSVADPKQFPAEECEKAAQWVVDAFAAAGLQDVRMSMTPDGSNCVHGHAPGPEGTPTVLLYCHYDVQPPLGEDAWTVPVFELTERDGRWYGRGSADCKGNIVMHLTALRALAQANGGFPCGIKLICEGSEEQGTGGLEAFVPGNVELLRADTILVVDTGNFAVGVPTLTTTLRGMTSVDVTLEALSSPMHSGMFGGPAPDPVVAMIQLLGSLHDEHGNTTIDGLDNRQRWTGVDYSAEQFRSDANVLDGVEADGRRVGRGHAVGAAVRHGARHRRAPRDRLLRRDPGVGRGAREPADPERGRRYRGAQDALVEHLAAACPGAWNARSSASPWATRSRGRCRGLATSR